MRRSGHVWILAALLFAAALTLFTRENQFPFYYHPDEPGKVRQVQTADWNFNHPMLMLSTTRLAAKGFGNLENPQQLVEVGRFVSALFAAGSVALLAAMAWITVGRFAALAAGLLLLTNHQLFELAHYFKEDTALLFGLSAWFLALALYWKRPHWGTAALVGAGAALALSGKYLGVFAPLLSLWLIPHRSKEGGRAVLLAAFVGAFLAVFVLVNLPLLLQLTNFKSSFDRELNLVVKGQGGMTRSVPNTVYLSALRVNVFFGLWTMIALHYANCWRRRRELSAFEWVLTLFPICFLIALSFSPKTNDRYFLPATTLFLVAVAFGMDQARKRWPLRLMAPGLLVAAVLMQTPALVRYYRAFQIDDRAELTRWLNATLPAATIAQDQRVMLPTAKRKDILPYQPELKAGVIGKKLDSDPDLSRFHSLGVTHLVLSQSDYGRYNLKSLRSQAGSEKAHEKSREFYRSITAGKPLWERPRGTVIYLHPGLEVYPLPPL